MTLSAEPATAPSALRHARARHPRLARVWRALTGPGPRRALSRAVTLLAIVGCLVQPAAPVAALRNDPQPLAQPGLGALAGPALDRGLGKGVEAPAAAPLAATSPVQGITVYAQSDVNCASPHTQM